MKITVKFSILLHLLLGSDEPIETCHGQLRFMERRHNYRCNRSLVGKYKGKRSKASFDLWNLRSLQLMAKTRNKNGKFCCLFIHILRSIITFSQDISKIYTMNF